MPHDRELRQTIVFARTTNIIVVLGGTSGFAAALVLIGVVASVGIVGMMAILVCRMV